MDKLDLESILTERLKNLLVDRLTDKVAGPYVQQRTPAYGPAKAFY